jgi:CheY-like chemotaxis protein
MTTFEEFESHLREVLAHLYDPHYQPHEQLWTVLGCEPQRGVEALQSLIVQEIKRLEPTPDTPPAARIRRYYELLSARFIQGMTQEETAILLNFSLRHIRREQQRAVALLARRFWDQKSDKQRLGIPGRSDDDQVSGLPAAEGDSTAWRMQVRHELVSLQRSAPGVVTDIGTAVSSAAKLSEVLFTENQIELKVLIPPPGLAVTVHPSILNQILMTAIEKVAQQMSSGQITMGAERENRDVKITITGQPAATRLPLYNSDFIEEILNIVGGSSQVHVENNQVTFTLRLLSAHKIMVLVVDDNADLVHFYRRYTMDTRYEIVHVAEGQRVFEKIEEVPPDLIVLDVMLPDSNGWDLLTQLRQHPLTQHVPVIVCSVVRREKLALALGATMYVPKPVGYQQFVQALDKAINQAEP